MSVNLRAIQVPAASARAQVERARERQRGDEPTKDFASFLTQDAASTASRSDTRRPGAPGTPTIPSEAAPVRTAAPSTGSERNLAADGNEVTSTGRLSTDPRTAGMYIPPDFYHGSSYSPVFDTQNENGEWVPTPRFEGQQIWGHWRGSKPADWDPNARVQHDPLMKDQGYRYWKQDESGNWVRRPTAYGGIPLDDDGVPMFTPDPSKYPEYFVASPPEDEDVA